MTLEEHIKRGTTCKECSHCRKLQYYTKQNKKEYAKYKKQYVCTLHDICKDVRVLVIAIAKGYICECFDFRKTKNASLKSKRCI